MPHETNLFSAVNRDFRILMKATEKNPNVLQACSRISKSTAIRKNAHWLSGNAVVVVVVVVVVTIVTQWCSHAVVLIVVSYPTTLYICYKY